MIKGKFMMWEKNKKKRFTYNLILGVSNPRVAL